MSRDLENAIVRLLRERPFYGHFILNLRREERRLDGRPAGVTIRDGIPAMAVDPDIFARYSLRGQQALLEHLVKHLLHLHMLRRKGRNQHDWDICCDLALNSLADELPPDACMPVDYGVKDALAAEEYYDLLARPFDTGNLEGSGYGDAGESEQGAAGEGNGTIPGITSDDHQIWSEADSTPLPLAEEMMRAVSRATLGALDGETPAELRAVLDALLKPSPIPWHQVLRQFIATAGRVGRKSSWMREHRRFSHNTPGVRKRHRLNLLVGIDVSDSTNVVALREAFAKELLHLARGCDGRITVLYANSRIQKVDSFCGSIFEPQRYDGGGFTDLRPVFEYARQMHPLPAAVIYLTDGIGPVPEKMEFPTLWALTADGEKPAPWGVELRLEI